MLNFICVLIYYYKDLFFKDIIKNITSKLVE